MDGDELQAVIDSLAAVHHSAETGKDLDRAVHEVLLRVRPFHSDAFDFAARLEPHADPAFRAARADVLGEVCNGDPDFVPLVLPVLEGMASNESDPIVLSSLAAALGKMWDRCAIPLLVSWADHPDDNIRFEVASALHGTMSNDSDPNAVRALIGLTRDPVALVRDWATFGLGNSAASGPEVERALLDRITDDDQDTRAEAFLALAERCDNRIVEPLIVLLSGDSVGTLEIRAAAKLADVRFHPALVAVREWWGDDDREVIEHAVRRCDPGIRSHAISTEERVVADVLACLAKLGFDQFSVVIEGEYPATELVIAVGETIATTELWAYDDEDPQSLDVEFTVRRIVYLAGSLVMRCFGGWR